MVVLRKNPTVMTVSGNPQLTNQVTVMPLFVSCLRVKDRNFRGCVTGITSSKGPSGQWYIEKSLTTIGQNDPVSELNSRLWNSGIEDDKEIARKQKHRLHYVSNILVVSDPSNPSNNGKVFLYDFGKKIFDKIMDKMQPEFPGEEVNPFDFWNGADFQLKIRNVAGYRNYDKSEFKAPSTCSKRMRFDWKQLTINSLI